MKYFVQYITVLLTVYSAKTDCIAHPDTFTIMNDSRVQKINANTYIGTKELPYKEYDAEVENINNAFSLRRFTSRFTKKKQAIIKHDNVYFVMERLTFHNLSFWQSFLQTEKVTARSPIECNGKTINLNDGINAFQAALNMLNSSNPYSIWIAYASRNKPNIILQSDDIYNDNLCNTNDIEMACTFFGDNTSLVTTHMGIFRTYPYFHPIANPHLGLSIELHGFVGFVSTIILPHAQYMVTKPVTAMLKIFKEKLQIGEDIWMGCAKQRTARQKRMDQNNYDLQLLKTFENDQSSLNMNDLTSFTSLDSDALKMIQPLYVFELQRSCTILDYLETHTAQELNLQLQLGRIDSTPNLNIEVSEDRLKEEIKIACAKIGHFNSQESLKNKIRKKVEEHTHNFFYNQVHEQLTRKESLLRTRQTREPSQYLPEPLSYLTPLDNRDPDNWILHSPNGEEIFFNRPEWFPPYTQETPRTTGHYCLSINYLPTTIISISTLSKIWLTPSKT